MDAKKAALLQKLEKESSDLMDRIRSEQNIDKKKVLIVMLVGIVM